MEYSKITGDDGEECNSNESGWTMYLGSPVSSDDVKANDSEGSNVGGDCSNGRSKNNNMDDDDDGGYDSLTSDASTGPAQVKMHNGKEKKGQQTKPKKGNRLAKNAYQKHRYECIYQHWSRG